MLELRLDYTVAKETPWKPDYVEAVTAETLVAEIHRLQSLVTTAEADPTNVTFFQGFKDYLKVFYLREVVIGEGMMGPHTSVDNIESLLAAPSEDSNVGAKTHNLLRALKTFLPEINRAEAPAAVSFTPELLLSIHREVGRGVIPDAGTIRTKWLAPAQEDWIYLAPHLVRSSLDTLCREVQRAIERIDKTDLLARVRLAASFMTIFLHIHPFSNGNGRVARLAMSWLLRDVTTVPVPLITSIAGRDMYLDAIRDSRHIAPFLPVNLARLILESVHKTIQKAVFCLDL